MTGTRFCEIDGRVTRGHAVWGAGAGAGLKSLATSRCVFARLTAGCSGACHLGILACWFGMLFGLLFGGNRSCLYLGSMLV